MSDVKKIATRDSYGNALCELGEVYPDLVVLDADLAEATRTSVFKKKYPERHIDCGIAESNMECCNHHLNGILPACGNKLQIARRQKGDENDYSHCDP